MFQEKDLRVEQRGHRPDDESKSADFEHNDPGHPGQLIMGDPACVSAVCDTHLDGSARGVAFSAAQEEHNKFVRNMKSSLDVRQRGDRLIPLVITEHGAMPDLVDLAYTGNWGDITPHGRALSTARSLY